MPPGVVVKADLQVARCQGAVSLTVRKQEGLLKRCLSEKIQSILVLRLCLTAEAHDHVCGQRHLSTCMHAFIRYVQAS